MLTTLCILPSLILWPLDTWMTGRAREVMRDVPTSARSALPVRGRRGTLPECYRTSDPT